MSNYSIALSGLQNQSAAIDAVSNNIANANTVGYKAGDYLFADQFVRAVNPADGARAGMGTQTLGVRRAMTQGTITNSSNPLDLAISGNGMFRLLKGSGTAGSVDPSAVYYSRNGQFAVDKDGYIVNENGMYLTGYQATPDGAGVTDDLIKNNGLLKMPNSNLPGNETTYSRLSALLDSKGNAFTSDANVSFDPGQNTYNNKTTQTIFDAEGNSHTLEVYYRRVNDGVLRITSGSTGFTYPPSKSSDPNTLGETLVTLNKNSVVSVDTAPAAQAQAVSTSNTTLTLESALTLTAGQRVFVNGVDSGQTVASGSTGTSVTLSGAISMPNGATVSFYPALAPTESTTAGAAANNTKTLTLATDPATSVLGMRVFIGGKDTGATVTADNGTTVTLSDTVTAANGAAVAFVPETQLLNMTLTTPDGSKVTVQGWSNAQNSGNVLTSTMARVEVYASLDGHFYGSSTEPPASTNRTTITNQTPGTNGYKPASELLFIGGRNIDALVTEPLSGNPQFKTTAQLTTRVTNQAGGTSDLVFDLDLTDTTLQAGAFQVTHSSQNGEPLARLTNVTVDNQGRIVGVYGTGKQQYIGQLALVHFDNFEGLMPVGKNAFAATISSGTEHSADGVVVGRAGTGIFGDIKAQAVESSNVDLANELVRLMVLQRSYTANSQSMRAFDQTLRDTLQIIS